MYNDLLATRYLEVLKDLEPSCLDRGMPTAVSEMVQSRAGTGLSGIFLPSVSEAFDRARLRIMVIGSETAGWNVLDKSEIRPALPLYIEKAMAKHKTFFARQLGIRNSSGYTFHNFMRSVRDQCGADGLIYSNLFCFDWNRGSPLRQKELFPAIEKYSELLLKVQINVLQPDIIVFANGMQSVTSRRKFFPIEGEHSVCSNGHDYSNQEMRIPKHHLWAFQLNNRITCFRIHHPSARSAEAARARKFLIKLLPGQ